MSQHMWIRLQVKTFCKAVSGQIYWHVKRDWLWETRQRKQSEQNIKTWEWICKVTQLWETISTLPSCPERTRASNNTSQWCQRTNEIKKEDTVRDLYKRTRKAVLLSVILSNKIKWYVVRKCKQCQQECAENHEQLLRWKNSIWKSLI